MARARRSKVPLVLGAIVIVGGGAVAAIVATRGGGGAGATTSGSGVASGSAAIVATGSGSAMGSAAVMPPPPPPPEPKLPDMVSIVLDSTPHGATVTDLSTGKPCKDKTPLKFSLPGSKTPRQFSIHLHGYGDSIVELALVRDSISYVEPLQKGASSATPVVHKAGDPTLKPIPDAGGGAVTKPDTGSAAVVKPDTGSAAVVKPDTGSAAVVKPDTGSAAVVKPDTGSAKPNTKPCPDDEMPCLKGFGSGQ